MGLDVGRSGAVGLRTVSLGPMGHDWRSLVLVARWLLRASLMGPCASRLRRWPHQRRLRRPGGRLVSACTLKSVLPYFPHNTRYVTIINQTIINSPPRGVPPNRNHEGTTMVPGPRFRDPVMKVALPVRTNVAELQAVAPPPKHIAPVRRVVEDNMIRRPNQVQPSPQASTPAPVGHPVPAPSMVPSPAGTVRSPTG